ncbi:transmembrane protein PVRIG isoform X1 [Castor canadensis]|uniref:Transmembrane protein PVRIG isoform X1 n=1 Tax=Castor canadensis TaxID=51338 RepID=A0A8B7WBD9_CASCN
MARPPEWVLLWALLTLCISAETPRVWVQVQREAFKLWPLRIRCGFLGPGSISQVTVNWGGHDDAGGTLLAVLHPEFGVHCQAPVCQAQWETKSTIAVMLEGSEARSSWANATFCCKFVSFPDGSQETCGYPQSGSVEHSSDQGSPALTQAPILRADLAWILGALGLLLLGFIFVFYMRRQRRWSVIRLQPSLTSTQAQMPAQATSQARLTALYLPYTTTTLCPETRDTIHPHHCLPQWAPLTTYSTHQPLAPALWASIWVSSRSSFVCVENGLYARAGERPSRTGPNLTSFLDPLGPRAMERHLGVE